MCAKDFFIVGDRIVELRLESAVEEVLTALMGTNFMSLNGKGVAKIWRRTESTSGHPFRRVVLLPLSMPF